MPIFKCHLLDNLFAVSTAKNAPVGNISHWETFILLFFILGYKELKVEREYRDKMFNGFINGWFDYWYKRYDYADMWKWLKNKKFLVFCITIFSRKSTKWKQSRDQDDLSLMMKIHKTKSLKQVHFRLGWDEMIFRFEKHKAANKHINWTNE